MTHPRPDYGVDAPGVIRGLVLAGLAEAAWSIWFPVVHIGSLTLLFPRWSTATIAALFFGEAALMLLYARWGKFRHRDRILAMADWSRVQTALDVGTGRGLLLAALGHRLPQGHAVGVDIFQAKDLSGNLPANTLRNLELEGVAANTEVRHEDARQLSLPDASVDLVVSNLCIHNIRGKAERDRALAEIVRVLRPGGRALISDFINTGVYARTFRRLGMRVRRTPFRLYEFPPLRTVIVDKPD